MKENVDRKFFRSQVGSEISDIIFKQHMSDCSGLNFCIVWVQLILLIISLIFTIFTNIRISMYTMYINIALMMIVLLNNAICGRAWGKAKEGQYKIEAMLDIIEDKDLTDEDVHLHMAGLMRYRIIHSDKDFEKIISNMYDYLYMKKREVTKYKDKDGKNYKVGDIVLNPFFGDFWVVEKLNAEEMKAYEFEMPYILSLNGNKDDYAMELDMPSNFQIVCTPETSIYAYITYIVAFGKIYKTIKQHLEELDDEPDIENVDDKKDKE